MGGEHDDTPLQILNDRNDYKRWVSGTTGYTYVDACMKCLQSTGYLHDSGRCAVAMFLTKVLKCDWRWGAEAFRYYLIDHDSASNVANWQSLAGVGTELKKERDRNIEEQELKFNPILYGMQNEDEQCSFIKQWLPCFGGLPNIFVHEPWKTPESIKIPKCYRSPVVDPAVFHQPSPTQQNLTSDNNTTAIKNNNGNSNDILSQNNAQNIQAANTTSVLQQQILENQLLMQALEQQKQQHQQNQQQQQQQQHDTMDDN